MSLIDRLSKLDGPDREVDAEISIHFGAKPNMKLGHELLGNYRVVPNTFPAYTASVDAAIALAERVLPGANVLIGWGQTKETKPWARIGVTPSHDATCFNLAIALCIAILRAKEASNGQ